MARSKREIEIRTIEITTAFKLFLELYADDERYSIDIEKAAKNIDQAEVRTRQMTRKLKSVEALPADTAQSLLGTSIDASDADVE